MKWLALSLLLLAGPAWGQVSCAAQAEQLKAAASLGELVNRDPDDGGYLLRPMTFHLLVRRVESPRLIEVRQMPNMPGVIEMVACHGVMVDDQGRRYSGTYVNQRVGMALITSWISDAP